MSLVEMQSVLARLYVDGPFLDRFCVEPASVLGDYDLTAREASALAGVDRDGIRSFASSLRAKSFARFKVPYRLLRALDKDIAFRYYRRFFELRPWRPNEPFYAPVVELGEFYERSFSGNPVLPPYASELARYERMFFIARFQPRVGITAAPEPPPEGSLTPDSRPRARPGLSVERFEYDMRTLDKELSEERIPQGVGREECHVVFQSFPRLGRARKFRVSAATAALLALCDGERDLSSLAKTLDAGVDTTTNAAEQLLRLRVVSLEEPAS